MPAEGVHAYVDAYGYGNDGLHIGVHTHECWAYALLANGNEQIGDEGGKDDEE